MGRGPTYYNAQATSPHGERNVLIVPPSGPLSGGTRVRWAPALNIGNGYARHGTNRPKAIGKAVSHGCVRLRNEDIEKLYGMVPVGTPVYIY